MPITITDRFSSVRTAFYNLGYGIANNLLAYRKGGGIVPNSAYWDSIGTGAGTLRLKQFQNFSVRDLIRFIPGQDGAAAINYNSSNRASSGQFEGNILTAEIAWSPNKTSYYGGSSTTVWGTSPGTIDDGPVPGFPIQNWAFGPTSWASEDAVGTGYEFRVNVTSYNLYSGGTLQFGYTGNPGTFFSFTGTGTSPWYTMPSSPNYMLLILTSGGAVCQGTIHIRSAAYPSVEISTGWYLEAEGDA